MKTVQTRRKTWENVVAVAQIQTHPQSQLLLIIHAPGLARLGFGGGEGGQQQRRQDGDDGDDDQQLNQSETASTGLSHIDWHIDWTVALLGAHE